MLLRREKDTVELTHERRIMRRFDMRLPAAVRVAGGQMDEFLTETQNVSARGVFFYLDRPVEEGSRVEVTMTFPPARHAHRPGSRSLYGSGNPGRAASAFRAHRHRCSDRRVRISSLNWSSRRFPTNTEP